MHCMIAWNIGLFKYKIWITDKPPHGLAVNCNFVDRLSNVGDTLTKASGHLAKHNLDYLPNSQGQADKYSIINITRLADIPSVNKAA